MVRLLSTVLLIAFVVQMCNAAAVIELSSSNFHEKTSSGKWFIKFYAPWCGHCKTLAPIWEELATEINPKGGYQIAHVDCTKHTDICNEHEVRGYPTLKTIDNGKAEKYTKARSISALKEHISSSKESVDESSKVTVLTQDSFDDAVNSKVHFVKFYAPWCGHCKRLAPIWDELAAKSVADTVIAKVDCTEHKDICQKYDVRGYPTLKLVHKGNTKDYSGSRAIGDLGDFVNNNPTI